MGVEKVQEAWSNLLEALNMYEESLQGEVEEALRERRIEALPGLQAQLKRLRQLRTLLHRAEKLLPS